MYGFNNGNSTTETFINSEIAFAKFKVKKVAPAPFDKFTTPIFLELTGISFTSSMAFFSPLNKFLKFMLLANFSLTFWYCI